MDNFKILIIEDESLIALRIKQILEKNNFNVVGIAKDSVSAISYVQKNSINLILADITIQGYLNGIETLKLIQESFDIPAIFLTSHQEDKFLVEATEVNFTGYIVKPFIEETLIREVKLAFHRFNSNHTPQIKLTTQYTYDVEKQIIKDNDIEIKLSKNEKFFLHILIINRNRLVTNEQIDQLLWSDKPIDDVSRRQLLFRLRKKIPNLDIHTIKSEGYKLII